MGVHQAQERQGRGVSGAGDTAQRTQARAVEQARALKKPSGLVKSGGTGHGMAVSHKQEGRGLPVFSQQDKRVIRHIPQLRMMVLNGVALFHHRPAGRRDAEGGREGRPFPVFREFHAVGRYMPVIPRAVRPFEPFTGKSQHEAPCCRGQKRFSGSLP